MYRGIPGNNKKLGIKPTDKDRAFVHVLARMKLGVRRIGVIMGEHHGLGKPMSRMALYYHYREALKVSDRERKNKVRFRLIHGLTDAIDRVIKNGT